MATCCFPQFILFNRVPSPCPKVTWCQSNFSFLTMPYYDTYRDQLANLYRGHALWDPDPAGLYDRVRVGDVGFVRKGHFLRMFNAFLPANHPTQVYGVPEGFAPLNTGSNTRMRNLSSGDYCSQTVRVEYQNRRAVYVTSFYRNLIIMRSTTSAVQTRLRALHSNAAKETKAPFSTFPSLAIKLTLFAPKPSKRTSGSIATVGQILR